MMFTLDEGDQEQMMIIHHEMTHLGEGTYPFMIPASFPLSLELRKMFFEGHAVTRESYVDVDSLYYQTEILQDLYSSLKLYSKYSYPLYGYLYQILQIIFGDTILEEMCKNNDKTKNMCMLMKQRFSSVSVETIFAHLIYILSCFNHIESEVLRSSIDYYEKFYDNETKFYCENENFNNDVFVQALEEVCFTNPSLINSFEFLKGVALKKTQTTAVSTQDKEFLIAQVRKLLELNRSMKIMEYQKSSLFS